MKAAHFVARLAQLAPDVQQLRALGLSADDAERLRGSFICTPRGADHDRDDGDALIQLTSHWDVRNVEIGMVRLAACTPSELGVQVGVVEVEPLVVSASGEVVVVDELKPDSILWPAARDGGMFLHAMLAATEFLEQRARDEIDWEDFAAARETAQRCADAAGGAKYLDFYGMLLGADP
jgi:hypothetical protein